MTKRRRARRTEDSKATSSAKPLRPVHKSPSLHTETHTQAFNLPLHLSSLSTNPNRRINKTMNGATSRRMSPSSLHLLSLMPSLSSCAGNFGHARQGGNKGGVVQRVSSNKGVNGGPDNKGKRGSILGNKQEEERKGRGLESGRGSA